MLKQKFGQAQERLAYVVNMLEEKINSLIEERDNLQKLVDEVKNENKKIKIECEKAFKDVNNSLQLIEDIRKKYVNSNTEH